MPLWPSILAAIALLCSLATPPASAQPSRPNASTVLDDVVAVERSGELGENQRALLQLGAISLTEEAWSPALRMQRLEVLGRIRPRENLDPAIAAFLTDNRSSPHASTAWIVRGLNAMGHRQYGQARVYLDEAVRAATQDDQVLDEDAAGAASYWLGIAHLVDPDGALREPAILALTAASQLYPRSRYADDAFFALGELHESAGSLDTALAMYAQILERYPSSEYYLDAALRTAQTYLRLDRPVDALPILDRIGVDLYVRRGQLGADLDQLAQQETEYHLLRAEASAATGDNAAAERSYLAVIDQPATPFRRIALLGLADTYRAANRDDSSTAIYLRLARDTAGDYAGMHAQFQLALAGLVPPYDPAARQEMIAISRDSTHLLRDQARLALAKVHYLAQEIDSVEDLLQVIPDDAPPATRAQAYLVRGAARLAAGRYSNAAADMSDAARIARSTPRSLMPERDSLATVAILYGAIAQIYCGRAADAVPQLNRLLQLPPPPAIAAEAAYWLGEAFYVAGSLPASVQALEDMIEQYPASHRIQDALYTIGWAQFRQKKLEPAESAFSRLVKAYPLTPYASAANLRRGDCLYLLQRYADAAAAYDAVDSSMTDPDIVEYARYQGALAIYHRDQLDNALGRFSAFSSRYVTSELADDAVFMQGLIQYRQKRYGEAARSLSAFATAYPTSTLLPRALTTLAGAWYSTGNYDSAYGAASTVVERFAGSYYAEDARVGMEKADAARREKVRQERLAERNWQDDLAAADRLFRNGDYAAALVAYSDLTDQCPDSTAANRLSMAIARAALGVGDTARAIDTLRALTQRQTAPAISAAAYESLATIATARGSRDTARAYLRSLADVPDSAAPWALLRVADIQIADSAWSDAVITLNSVVNRYPAEHPVAGRASLRLAGVYESMGDKDRAKEIYRTIIENYRGEEVSRTAEDRLRTMGNL